MKRRSRGARASDGPARREQSFAERAVHLVVLSSLAVAHPILDLLSRHGEFFAVWAFSRTGLVALVIGLIVLVPLPLIILEAIASRIRPGFGRALHLLFVTGLAYLLAAQVLRRLEALPAGVAITLAVILGAAAAAAYQRLSWVRSLTSMAKIALIAILTEAPLNFMAYDVIGKEKEIIGSSMCTNTDVIRAIEMVVSGEVDVEGILTHVLPLEEAPRGMELAQNKDEDAIKVILNF